MGKGIIISWENKLKGKKNDSKLQVGEEFIGPEVRRESFVSCTLCAGKDGQDRRADQSGQVTDGLVAG